jgi:hypothetical protein
MKKKELKAELEYLRKVIESQREDIRTLLSDGKEFDKQMIKVKYDLEIDIQNVMWQGCKGDLVGAFNGIIINEGNSFVI